MAGKSRTVAMSSAPERGTAFRATERRTAGNARPGMDSVTFRSSAGLVVRKNPSLPAPRVRLKPGRGRTRSRCSPAGRPSSRKLPLWSVTARAAADRKMKEAQEAQAKAAELEAQVTPPPGKTDT